MATVPAFTEEQVNAICDVLGDNTGPTITAALIQQARCALLYFGGIAACETVHGHDVADLPWPEEFTECMRDNAVAYIQCANMGA